MLHYYAQYYGVSTLGKYCTKVLDMSCTVAKYHLYKISADAGYAPAQWCFGLNSINGTGMTKNISEGIFYIRMSAEQRYEEAVNFMLNEITNELYGIERNEREIGKWKMISEQLL